jgi:protein SCO1
MDAKKQPQRGIPMRFASPLALTAVVLSLLTIASAEAGGVKRWGEGYFPNSTVYDQNGTALRFYDDVIRNKIVLVSFIYAKCHDLCPLTTARLAEVRHRLGDVVGRDVFFVSISIDPENDTPAVLKAFAEPFDAGPGWLFLTGASADINQIRKKFGELSSDKSDHMAEVVLGNDRTGEWARDSAMTDPTLLTMNVRAMDPVWRNTPQQMVPVAAKDIERPLPALPGVAMFRKMCMSCHTVGKGDKIGPDLAHITHRRSLEWLVNVISDPDKVRRSGDKTLLDLTAKYKGTLMPNLGLSPAEAKELIGYIEVETHALHAAGQ